MNEHEVDRILTRLGREEFEPPAELIERTRKRLHCNRLLPYLVAVSLGLQIITFCAFQVFVFSAPVSATIRVLAQAGSIGFAIILVAAILFVHGRVRTALCRFEAATGCR